MQQSSPTQPSPAASSFAGFLATLTAPQPAAIEDESGWSSSDLGEDVASLSYERALRAHARYRPVNRAGGLPTPPDGYATDAAADTVNVTAREDAAPESSKMQNRDLRSASVTIRLSKIECARLHQRAAEAGITISAYLRSCALEVETLRAEVKKTLTELRTAAETPPPAARARKPWLGWIGRILKR